MITIQEIEKKAAELRAKHGNERISQIRFYKGDKISFVSDFINTPVANVGTILKSGKFNKFWVSLVQEELKNCDSFTMFDSPLNSI